MEHNRAYLQAGLHNTAMSWDNLRMVEEYDLTVSLLVQLLAVYGLSATWSCLRGVPQQETSFYLTMATAAVGLYSLAWSVFKHGWGAVSGPLTLGFAGFGFVMALLALQAPETLLDTRLVAGLLDASNKAEAVLESVVKGGADTGAGGGLDLAPSLLVLHLLVAGVAGLIMGVMVVPSIRFASCFAALTADNAVSAPAKALLYVNMFGPLAVAALWLRPVLGSALLIPDLVKCNPGDVARDCTVTTDLSSTWLLTETAWLRVRVGAVLVCLALRLLQYRLLMSGYLAQAKTKQVDYLESSLGGFGATDQAKAVKRAAKKARKEGRSVKDAVAHAADVPVQAVGTLFHTCRNIARNTFSNLAVVGLQFVAPTAVIVALALALHHRGGLSLGLCSAVQQGAASAGLAPALESLQVDPSEPTKPSGMEMMVGWAMDAALGESGTEVAGQVRAALGTPLLWRPLFNFLLWWATLSMAVTSALAYMYFEGVVRFADSYRDEMRQQAQTARRTAVQETAAAAPAASASKRSKKKRRKAE